jgi:predicted site-specific integrase-resolvase
MNYKKAEQIMEIFQITKQTLNNWRHKNIIQYKKINARKFMYDMDSVQNFSELQTPKINVIYARVSQQKQKNDLESQINILKNYANNNGYKIDMTLSEIYSGMNENRPKFNELIDLVLNGKVKNIFITYKDRLSRFGFPYFENIFKKFNTNIVVLNSDNPQSLETELTQDLIDIIHYFSMKMYSNRRKVLNKIKNELKNG